MRKFASFAALAMVTTLALPPLAAAADDDQPIACSAEALAKIDGSTADDARRKMAAAGYTQITGLKKGCDNFWHGQAIKDGAPTGVVLAPDGRVQSEPRE